MNRTEHPPEDYATGSAPPISTAQRRLELWVIVGFWTFLALLTAAGRIVDPWTEQVRTAQTLQIILHVLLIYLPWALLTPLIFRMTRRYNVEKTNWSRMIPIYLGIAIFTAIAVDLYDDLLRLYLFPYHHRGPQVFNPLFAIMRFWFVNDLIVFMAVLSAGFARDYFLRYRARQQEAAVLRAQAAKLQSQLSEARLEALRMQINPHFLFNTLHAVSTLVERDPDGVRRIIARLSELLRYTLERSTDAEVPLRKEIEFVEKYLEIQQIRFQGKLDADIAIDPEVRDALVPNLILQPLVENAIKHGIGNALSSGRLRIRAEKSGGALVLRVEDNGPGLGGDGLPSNNRGYGIRITRDRIEALYGDAYGLTFDSPPEGGLAAIITIPYHTPSDLRVSVSE